MKPIGKFWERAASQSWWKSAPFVFALAVLLFIVWTTSLLVVYPYDGIGGSDVNGSIKDISPSGPSANKLEEGDIILSIDGKPWRSDIVTYNGKRAGDQVQFVVRRDGENKKVTITLGERSVSDFVISFVPIVVALIFWIIGLGVQLFKPPNAAANIAFAWAMVCAMSLTAGIASYLGPVWAVGLFNSLLWIVGPLSVLFHLYFPQETAYKFKKVLPVVLFSIAVCGILPYIFFGNGQIYSFPWYPQYINIGRIFLAVNLLIVVGLLFFTYQHADAPGARGKIRLVALGGGITALLLVTFTILPDALLNQAIIPYSVAFLILGLLPLTYGYAIFRLHLIEIERYVNRGATFLLVYSILGSLYLILYTVINRQAPNSLAYTPFIDVLLVLLLASILLPLNTRVKRFVDTVFYGGWYDYRLAITQITQGLEQINTDLHSLARTMGERLVQTLRLEEATVFLRDPEGDFSVIEISSRDHFGEIAPSIYPVLPRSSLTYLLDIGVIERGNLRKELSQVTLYPEELQLLEKEQIHLWVPVIGHGQIQGLLALGPKLGGDIFSSEDMDILRVVARQFSPLIENLHLLTRLRQYASMLEQRVNERTEELFNAKERVEAILSSVGEGVIVTDLTGKILTVNTAFERQSGFRADEIINQNLHTLLSVDNSLLILSEMQMALRKAEIWSGDLVSRRKSGELFNLQLTIAPVRDQNGQIISYVGSQRDITRQKEFDRMKDMFVADVSHELRTPTTNINLYLDLLENASPEKNPQYIAVIKQQSQLLTRLVEDILDLSRLAKARTMPTEFTSVELNLLVEQAITAHMALADASSICLIFNSSPAPLLIFGEQNQIARMISNLISNAIRYTKEGEVCVKTYLEKDQACIAVHDTGIGIASEDLPHVYERFYRGRNVRQSKIPGTGLGLAIVKEIVELHAGKIEVQSELGKGSTFIVWLPCHE